jgi:hypothetical protein
MIGTRGLCNLEVSTIEIICETCGASNPPGTEFCTNCNTYLGWDRSVVTRPPGPTQPTSPAPAPPRQPRNDSAEQSPPPGNPRAGSPNAGSADQGYPNQSYADPGYASQGYGTQGYYDAGYNKRPNYPGGYYPDSGSSAPTLQQNAPGMSCPSCGKINPPTRRFCSRCGYPFVSGGVSDPYGGYGLSAASEAARDRAARKAYRRSLPPLYRWRRVIIGVLVVSLVTFVAVLLGSHPVAMVKSGWYSLRQEYVWVKPVTAAVVPANITAAKSNPAALVDEADNEWTMKWEPSAESPCGPAAGTGVVVLSFAPILIRLIQIAPGLAETNPRRKSQPLPKVLGIRFDNGPCHPVNLSAAPGQQEIKIDSGKPVSQVLIAIGSAYPAPNAKPLISLTEVILKAYPS